MEWYERLNQSKAVVIDENLYDVKDRIDIYVASDDTRSMIPNIIAAVDSGLFLKLSDGVSETNVDYFEQFNVT